MTSCHRALAVDAGPFSGYLWSILMSGPRSYCLFMKLCNQITFGAQNATKRLRKHTNDYHAMTSCHRALAVDAGSFSGYLWSILMGGPRSYCLFMKLCNQITFGAQKQNKTPEKTHKRPLGSLFWLFWCSLYWLDHNRMFAYNLICNIDWVRGQKVSFLLFFCRKIRG